MNRRNPNRYNNPNQTGLQNMVVPNRKIHAPFEQNRAIAVPQANTSTVRSGPCVLCQTSTVLLCQRCGDFYCSPNCQMKDWPKHRYICFQMPPLIHSSSRFTQDVPPLNGFQNRELPPTMSVDVSAKSTQNRTWHNNNNDPSPIQQNQQQKEHTVMDKKNEKIAVNIGLIPQASFPKSNSFVLLTAFRSSNRIFIRSIEKEENEGYCGVIKAINEYGKNAQPLKSMPNRNAFAITDFNNDGLFYRVQVVSVKSENEINVIYYDFGNEATKKLCELKEISKECAQLKQYIMLASLKSVPHITNNDKLKNYLKSFEDVEAKIVYDEKEKPACEIIICGVEESLNKKINLFIQLLKNKPDAVQKQQVSGKIDEKPKQELPLKKVENVADASPPKHVNNETELISDLPVVKPVSNSNEMPVTPANATKKRPSQLAKPVMVPPFDMVNLPVGQKNVEVMVVDNSLLLFGYFGCVLSSDKVNLQSIQSYLAEYEDNGQQYKPKVEEYCLAKFEGCWYRAKVLSILSSEFVEVVFIDFLNESQVKINCIRRYPMDLDYPCKTSLCMIEDLPSEISDNSVDILKEKLQPGSEHKINEIKAADEDAPDVLIVKMNQVAKWLSE